MYILKSKQDVLLHGHNKMLHLMLLLIVALISVTASSGRVLADTQQSLSKISEEEADVIRLKRQKSHLPFITIDKLHEIFSDVIVVDARSEFEYETLHIKGAYSAPVTNQGFKNIVSELREKFPNKSFIFYCNGFVCGKSYTATETALEMGLKNVFAFDRGIFAWAEKYPESSIYLNKTTLNHGQLIPDSKYNEHTIEAPEFVHQITKLPLSDIMVIDIRGPKQREDIPMHLGARRIETDKLIKILHELKDKKLFIIDQAGEQARWLQYHLESHNIHDYYILKGGAASFSKEKDERFTAK